MKRVSLRKQLFTLLIPFLFSLWIGSALLSFYLVTTFSSEAFDRDLINSADSVVGRLRVKQDKIFVDLPPAAQAILKHDESDRFYYRVIGSGGATISGDSGLPAPAPGLPLNSPRVVRAEVSGQQVRVAEIKVSLEEADGESVIVQVAATTNARTRFQEKMFLSMVLPQLAVIALGISAVWYGVGRILQPFRLLQERLTNRSQTNLSPLAVDDAPEEVYPLVEALNALFGRLKEDIEAHQRFIANAAHQLRTPLAGLKTYSSIGTEMTDPVELQQIVSDLDQGIDRASRMVSQLLALARNDANPAVNNRVELDLNFLVSDVVAELVDQAVRKNIDVHFDPAQVPATVHGDQSGLRHLISNLIENAIIYTPVGGKVNVCVRNDGYVSLIVSDTGRGIPPDEREKVFERFYRVVGSNGNGSGLGLSIVQEVAIAHNATVSVTQNGTRSGTSIAVEFRREA